MTRIMLALCASAMLSSGCVPSRLVIPDPTIPHRVATESDVVIWVRSADGNLTKTKVRLLAGWWIAGPPVVEAE